MALKLTLLNIGNIHTAPSIAGVYLLKHQPTGRMYFGSAVDLRARLRQWFYQIENVAYRDKLPVLIRITMHGGGTALWPMHGGYGNKPWDWFYAIIKESVPANFKPQVPAPLKPEWTHVQWLQQRSPELLLNDVHPNAPENRMPVLRGRKGVSPRRYLHGRLGLGADRFARGEPAHAHPLDVHLLPKTAGSPQVSFALYLDRALQATIGLPHECRNPSPAVIEDLFLHWLQFVPKHDIARTITPPGTINEALAVPVPEGY